LSVQDAARPKSPDGLEPAIGILPAIVLRDEWAASSRRRPGPFGCGGATSNARVRPSPGRTLLRPVLATATVLICLYIWNDVFFAFFVIGGRMDTLPLNLFQVASAGVYLNNWNLIFAYVVLMSLPLLGVFVAAQRRVISGITGGAVK
jgi:hypothetical protein